MKFIRLVFLSVMPLVFLACPTPPVVCGPSTCAGCCDANGQCQSGLGVTACGTLGRACDTCTASQTCQSGVCQAINNAGGGVGGSGVGGGSVGGGGAGGGTAGGQGGGMEVLACAPGLTLCGTSCVSTRTSFGNCGACNQACSTGQYCDNGACQNLPQSCTMGSCPANHYCDTRTSRCQFGCQGNSDCNGGQVCDQSRTLCVCPPNSTLCGGACVPNNTVTACGSRCLSCTASAGPNAVPACTNGTCDFTCQPGYHRCGNQCVSNFATATCGQRCDACMTPPNATPTCDGNDCGFVCAAGFHQCGSDCVSNFDVATCGNSCTPCQAPANAVSVCRSASPGGAPACDFECNPGFVRCGNQCRPESITACGATCATCTPPPGAANPQCVAGQCQYTCAAGFHQCGTQCVSNSSVATCGSMCTPCPTPSFGVATCNGTTCGVQCNPGFHECNGQCVSNNNVNTCGNRCSPCPAGPAGSGTTPTCDGTNCGLSCASSATPNFCNGMCVANSVTTCGSTCQTCTPPPNGTALCSFGTCDFTCNVGFHRCGNQCLPDSSPDSCGTSCTPCPPGPANTTTTCTQASPTSAFACGWSCAAGTNRCPANGNQCVPQDYTLACGATCAVCSATNALERGVCGSNGICTIDCINRCSNTCVNVQTSTTNCGSCGTTCGGTDRCSMGECRALCASGVGLSSLLPALTLNSTSFPFVVVDVNGDGRSDLVSVESLTVNVRLGEANAQGTGPSGTFSSTIFSSTSLGYSPTQIIAGDLTGDGRPELVVLTTTTALQVLRNGGTGFFTRYDVFTSFTPTSATIGDFIAGGNLDLLVSVNTASGTASATLYPGVTTTTLSPVGTAVNASLGIGSVSNVRLATVTADPNPDLVATAAANALFVFPGTGQSSAPFNGAGGASLQLPGSETFTSGIAGSAFPMEVGDVTSDGVTDVVVPVVSGATSGVRVFPLTATPAFGTSTFLATPAVVRAVGIADINGDGRRDVVVASTDVRVFLSQAGNTFSAPTVLGVSFSATFFNSLAVVDVTGDNRPEVITASGTTLTTAVNDGSGGFSTLQGASTPNATRVIAGDLNGDGLTDAVVTGPATGTFAGPDARLTGVTSPTPGVIGGRLEVLVNGVWGTVCAPSFPSSATMEVACRSVGLGSWWDYFYASGPTLAPVMQSPSCSSSFTSSLTSCFYSVPGASCTSANNLGIECQTTTTTTLFSQTQVLLAQSNGSFVSQPAFDTFGERFAIGNLNGDAPRDLVTVSSVPQADGGVAAPTVQVRLGATSGTLGTPVSLPTSGAPAFVLAADLTGDGLDELLVATPLGVDAYRNTGGATFAAPVRVSTVIASSLAVLDLNHDGRQDFVTFNSTFTSLQVHMNVSLPGTVGFVLGGSASVSGATNSTVRVGDVTYDGRPDVIVGSRVYQGTNAGTLSFFSSSLPVQPPNRVVVDLDNDGALDLVAGGAASSVLSVARGSSSTSFGFPLTAQGFTGGAPVEDVAVGRLDTDSRRDLVLLLGPPGARFVSGVRGTCR